MTIIHPGDYTTNKQKIQEVLQNHQQESGLPVSLEPVRVSLSVADETGRYCGGLNARINDQSMHIELLGVIPQSRTLGIGRQLMLEAIATAKAKGCTTVTVSTQDYQAKGFYLKLGFQVFGELENVPVKQTTKYYLVLYLD